LADGIDSKSYCYPLEGSALAAPRCQAFFVSAIAVDEDRPMRCVCDCSLLKLSRPSAVAIERFILSANHLHYFIKLLLTYRVDFFRVDIRFKLAYAVIVLITF
jgi:hypothetical protein